MRAPASILLALPLVKPIVMSPSRPLAACGVGVQRRWTGAVAQAASAVGKRMMRHWSSGDRRGKKLLVYTNEVVPFGVTVQVSAPEK
jgi:hypothetical protein